MIWFGPTLLDNVNPEMSVYTVEIFGPVLSMVCVEIYDEALNLINTNPYGNGTAIFTNDGGAARPAPPLPSPCARSRERPDTSSTAASKLIAAPAWPSTSNSSVSGERRRSCSHSSPELVRCRRSKPRRSWLARGRGRRHEALALVFECSSSLECLENVGTGCRAGWYGQVAVVSVTKHVEQNRRTGCTARMQGWAGCPLLVSRATAAFQVLSSCSGQKYSGAPATM